MNSAAPVPFRELNGKQQTFLDCVRLTATLCVLLSHAFSFAGYPAWLGEDFFFVLADFGVVLFFLLSGFLSAYTLEKKDADRSYRFSAFFAHKLSRIMREYLPALLFVAALDALAIRFHGELYRYYDTYDLKTFLGNLLFLHWTVLNRLPGVSILAFGSAKPLWTLSLEWYFYMIHALLLLSLRNRTQLRLRDFAILGLCLLLPIEYLIGGRGGGLGALFALGAFGYYFFDRLSRRSACFLFPGTLLLAICYMRLKENAYSIYVFLFVSLALCAGLRLLDGPGAGARRRILAHLSGASFMLYMLHYSIFDFVFFSDLPVSNAVKLLATLALSILVSLGMYTLFGRRNLPGRLFSRR